MSNLLHDVRRASNDNDLALDDSRSYAGSGSGSGIDASTSNASSSQDGSRSSSGRTTISGVSTLASRVGEEVATLVKQETNLVTLLWLIVLAMLSVAGVYVGQTTHALASNNEQVDFEEEVSCILQSLGRRRTSAHLFTVHIFCSINCEAFSSTREKYRSRLALSKFGSYFARP
jgi:hypothetical protein